MRLGLLPPTVYASASHANTSVSRVAIRIYPTEISEHLRILNLPLAYVTYARLRANLINALGSHRFYWTVGVCLGSRSTDCQLEDPMARSILSSADCRSPTGRFVIRIDICTIVAWQIAELLHVVERSTDHNCYSVTCDPIIAPRDIGKVRAANLIQYVKRATTT